VAVDHAGASTRDGPDAPLAGEDRRTAQLLHRVLDCDVAALLSVRPGVASLWLMTWTEAAAPVERRPPICPSWASAIVADLPLRGDPVVSRPGGVDLLPADRPGLRCQLVVPLVVGSSGMSAWLIGRTGRSFSREEIEHVTVLAPGLRMRRHDPDDFGAPAPVELLTCREVEVLSLVARGLTARAMAHRCGISERTVQKHLEHIYRKLGCRDRLSAVLRVHAEGLLDAPTGSDARSA
jgi:DNA-binding CsgD family transcriptional regulator